MTLPPGAVVERIACGGHHCCVVTDQGSVYQWGMDYERLSPSPKMVLFESPVRVTQIACGRKHSCALTDAADLYTWGCGFFGRLGHGTEKACPTPTLVKSLQASASGDHPVQVVCGGAHCAAVTVTGYAA
jgi:alpha-tubulin suppressor-like RCC1 family protein